MKFYRYIVLLSALVMASACAQEEFGQFQKEVQFGLSFDNANGTRTIYGLETATGFPIYWSEGDKVLVASPQCAVNSAEYQVTPVSGQSYAQAMNKVGAAGLQWGETNAYFYSIYPAAKASWKTLNEGEVAANLTIDSRQSANIVQNGNVYTSADMKNVIMYARTGEMERGKAVDLKYTPYSTILEFEVAIAPNKDTQGNETLNYGSARVMSMTLYAPEGTPIAGDFTFRFDGENRIVTPTGNNSDIITIDFKTQPLLDATNQKLYAKFALIPSTEIDITADGWMLELEVLEGNDSETTTYTKTLTINDPLEPGQVHKIKLPKLRSTEAWEPHMNKWIRELYDYKNIYLTELSVPGAWYAGAPTDDGYQSTDNIANLWNAGVRAFAVECKTATSSLFSNSPNAVVISGTGSNSPGLSGDKWYYGGTKIRTTIKSIADQVANSVVTENGVVVDGEYAVLVLSYADGGTGGLRARDFEYFINGVKTEISNSGASNIYDGEIDAFTTIEDVIGKLIIKINVDDNLTKSSYNGSMNALISYNPFLQQLPEGTSYSTPLFSKLYWSEWEDSYRATIANNSEDFIWCFSSANRTQSNTGTNTTIPTYSERQTALRSMIAHSKELTDKAGHNIWFYFNAGGVETTSSSDKNTSAETFASNMNPWLLEVIKLKANGGIDTNGVMGTAGAYIESDPSPLGIVMFNQCTNSTYKGPEIIKEIVEMNNKAKLLRAGTNDGEGDGDGELDDYSIN